MLMRCALHAPRRSRHLPLARLSTAAPTILPATAAGTVLAHGTALRRHAAAAGATRFRTHFSAQGWGAMAAEDAEWAQCCAVLTAAPAAAGCSLPTLLRLHSDLLMAQHAMSMDSVHPDARVPTQEATAAVGRVLTEELARYCNGSSGDLCLDIHGDFNYMRQKAELRDVAFVQHYSKFLGLQRLQSTPLGLQLLRYLPHVLQGLPGTKVEYSVLLHLLKDLHEQRLVRGQWELCHRPQVLDAMVSAVEGLVAADISPVQRARPALGAPGPGAAAPAQQQQQQQQDLDVQAAVSAMLAEDGLLPASALPTPAPSGAPPGMEGEAGEPGAAPLRGRHKHMSLRCLRLAMAYVSARGVPPGAAAYLQRLGVKLGEFFPPPTAPPSAAAMRLVHADVSLDILAEAAQCFSMLPPYGAAPPFMPHQRAAVEELMTGLTAALQKMLQRPGTAPPATAEAEAAAGAARYAFPSSDILLQISMLCAWVGHGGSPASRQLTDTLITATLAYLLHPHDSSSSSSKYLPLLPHTGNQLLLNIQRAGCVAPTLATALLQHLGSGGPLANPAAPPSARLLAVPPKYIYSANKHKTALLPQAALKVHFVPSHKSLPQLLRMAVWHCARVPEGLVQALVAQVTPEEFVLGDLPGYHAIWRLSSLLWACAVSGHLRTPGFLPWAAELEARLWPQLAAELAAAGVNGGSSSSSSSSTSTSTSTSTSSSSSSSSSQVPRDMVDSLYLITTYIAQRQQDLGALAAAAAAAAADGGDASAALQQVALALPPALQGHPWLSFSALAPLAHHIYDRPYTGFRAPPAIQWSHRAHRDISPDHMASQLRGLEENLLGAVAHLVVSSSSGGGKGGALGLREPRLLAGLGGLWGGAPNVLVRGGGVGGRAAWGAALVFLPPCAHVGGTYQRRPYEGDLRAYHGQLTPAAQVQLSIIKHRLRDEAGVQAWEAAGHGGEGGSSGGGGGRGREGEPAAAPFSLIKVPYYVCGNGAELREHLLGCLRSLNGSSQGLG